MPYTENAAINVASSSRLHFSLALIGEGGAINAGSGGVVSETSGGKDLPQEALIGASVPVGISLDDSWRNESGLASTAVRSVEAYHYGRP